jgi:DNA adenine methylase
MKKSPLRYPGGKSRAVARLRSFIPEFSEFREPFFGGGSLSFYLTQLYPDKKFSASDLNYELYCFWTQLQNNTGELTGALQQVYDSCKKKDHKKAGRALFDRIMQRRNDELSELQRATDFFVLNRISFSGVVDSGGFSQASFEGRFTQSAIARLSQAAPAIRSIAFHCADYSCLLSSPGDHVFIFLDPPYYSATKSKLYGRNGILHSRFDHEKLFADLQDISHQWLITYDNCPYIRSLYKDFFQLPWTLQYGMTNAASATGNELLIANYDLHKVHPSSRLTPIFASKS